MSDPSQGQPPSYDPSSLYEDPTPKRVIGPPPDDSTSPVLLVVLGVILVAVLGVLVYSMATSSDDGPAQVEEGTVDFDPVERFHQRTADLFEDDVPREQREAIGRSVCEFVDRSSDPRTVQQHFRATWGEADVRLLFDAASNAWCPHHAAILATG